MSDEPVLIDTIDTIIQITLNRPSNRNSMDSEVLPAFNDAINQARSDRKARCLIITGNGKSFCSGADFNNFKADDADDKSYLPNETFMSFYKPFLALLDIEIPIIAAMNGHAIGGGFGLALICDIRVANKTAKYGANFARLGLHSGMAISYMMPRLIGLPLANELLFTGRLINGEKAAEIGLANYAEPEDKVLERSWGLAKEIASCAPIAVRMMKRSIYRGLEWNPKTAAEIESHCQSRTFEMDDAKEGITALLEKREPIFKGC
ncbi:enoyl-CoA hydratase/isomerase family protein [bacterium]|nr:enoyl-CoA hydratase/isomerase family protein [bacterium]